MKKVKLIPQSWQPVDLATETPPSSRAASFLQTPPPTPPTRHTPHTRHTRSPGARDPRRGRYFREEEEEVGGETPPQPQYIKENVARLREFLSNREVPVKVIDASEFCAVLCRACVMVFFHVPACRAYP